MNVIATETHTLAEVKKGHSARIIGFTDVTLSLKMLEMGCLPNVVLTVVNEAPLGCPVCISIGNNNQLALRKTEAETVLVEVIPQKYI